MIQRQTLLKNFLEFFGIVRFVILAKQGALDIFFGSNHLKVTACLVADFLIFAF